MNYKQFTQKEKSSEFHKRRQINLPGSEQQVNIQDQL